MEEVKAGAGLNPGMLEIALPYGALFSSYVDLLGLSFKTTK